MDLKSDTCPDKLHGNQVSGCRRLRITIRGAVQGVGFRPFVYRLATNLGLTGWVNNSPMGVGLEVEGEENRLQEFLKLLEDETPPRASIQGLEYSFLDPVSYTVFEIRPSRNDGQKTATVLPDLATCKDCLGEIFDREDRRYLYPFTNCTNCGPRYSIIEALPYDRPQTTMRHFTMCSSCREEYHNPLDRRFHAQPNACPECGPQLELWDRQGAVKESQHGALTSTVLALSRGEIVAVKGLGGFHLLVDARNQDAVARLRKRKARRGKPFALMFPSLEVIRSECEVEPVEEQLLLSPEAPIVLLRRSAGPSVRSRIASAVAPGNPLLGAMLPYTPLHHIILRMVGHPLVATSGNPSDEPICTDEREALKRLGGIADFFLVHHREIHRAVDDSIVQVTMGQPQVLRRARGYAPLPVSLPLTLRPTLAVGAQLKSTIATGLGREALVSQHLGDLDSLETVRLFQSTMTSFPRLHDLKPVVIACDTHPDYTSTKLAESSGLTVARVQHHYAHILACMAENELEAPVLGIAWDGTGFGTDGTIWGGEFLLVNETGFERLAHFRPFRLPGGEAAVREPRRAALGALFEVFGDDLFAVDHLAPLQQFSRRERDNLQTMLNRGLNSPLTSSVGRLFDAVASILNIRHRSDFEGQAAMELEFAVSGHETDRSYPFCWPPDPAEKDLRLDWLTMLRSILKDLDQDVAVGEIAAKFQNTLAEIAVAVAQHCGKTRVALSGGCFQNRYLSGRLTERLQDEGFHPYSHQRIPPNDGGIALGQLIGAGRMQKGE